MAHWLDRVDGFIGRVIFRAVALLCGVIALICAYAAWWQVEHWDPRNGWLPVILFALAAVAAASVIPFCLSRKRRLVEALDAMESDVPDLSRRR